MLIDGGRLQEFLELWREAEGRIKRTERIRADLTVPAVNELRYAGYHLLEALMATSDASKQDLIGQAKNHCKRATYDAVEAEVMHLLDSHDAFCRNYGKIVLSEVPNLDWLKQVKAARAVRKLLRTSNQSKEEHYKEILAHCDAMTDALETCEAARDELNKKLREAETARRRFILTAVSIPAVGILLATIIGFWNHQPAAQAATVGSASSIPSAAPSH